MKKLAKAEVDSEADQTVECIKITAMTNDELESDYGFLRRRLDVLEDLYRQNEKKLPADIKRKMLYTISKLNYILGHWEE